MADSQSHARLLNPWVLHFQKLGLELKCPFCLNLYNNPTLLPCNHIFCSSCVPNSNLFGSQCPLCKSPYVVQELRKASHMENVVNIYRNLDAAFSMQMLNPGMGKVIDSSPPGSMIATPSSFSLMGNKRVQVPNDVSVISQLEKNNGFRGSVMRPECGKQDFPACENYPSSSIPRQSRTTTQQRQIGAVNVDFNQVELSPESSPSSGAGEGAETDSRDAGSSDDTAEKWTSIDKCAKRTVDYVEAQMDHAFSDSCFKKQKQHTQVIEGYLVPSAVPATTVSEMNTRPGFSSYDHRTVESDSNSMINFICAFCQSWKTTEGSGPMQHFANGIQVFGSDTGRSNVVHVHRRCIEWAPQIFFESDTVVKNVEKELARAAKLKCTSCGLKGAALGCFAKTCRRTYHVPCASQIAACRWDSDDFLMLCPSHASHKFPSEKHRKPAIKSCTTSTQIYDEQESSPKPDFWATSPAGAESWVLCGSALSANEKSMLVKFAKLCGASVTRAWNPDVTHVIAATDANDACSRTLKVLMAILNGRWILTTDWIKVCLQEKSYVNEEPYEISLDNHGCTGGPKTGRLKASSNALSLFSGLKFLFTGDFMPTYKNDIEELIIAAGGAVLESREKLLESSSPSTVLVVYNGDDLMETEDSSHVVQRQAEAARVAVETGSRVIAHTWILDSIASYELQPFVL